MEVAVAVVSAVTKSVVSKLTVMEKRYKELKDLEGDIGFLHRELAMICGSMEVQISHKGQPSAVEILSMDEFRALAHNIEDCLDRFLPCAACEGELQIRDPRKFCHEIARLKRELDAAHERKVRYNADFCSAAAESNLDDNPVDQENPGAYGASPAVGIEEAKQELCKSLVDGGGGGGSGQASRRKLKVVSVVGFGGSGKTALAWEVYNCPQVAEQFSRRAWVTLASKHKHDVAAKEALLKAILEGLLGDEARESVPLKLRQLQQHVSLLLRTKRCLIVLDNIKMEIWDTIKPIFPNETESRILVTTTVNSVANACSLPDGYVHSMRSLTPEQSKDYLDKKVFVNGCSPDLDKGSTAIVNGCDGHPLALVSVAKALQGHKLTGDLCEKMIHNLCFRMDENENGHFTKLAQVLMNNYSSLPGNSLKTCLLYSSAFPNDRPVSRKTLTSRWLAEGYIDGDQEIANKKLDELIDRNIIRPVDPSNNGKAKTCEPHGIMHQFMLHKSMASNFIDTSFGAKNRSNFRHLIIDNRTNGTTGNMGHGTGPAGRGRDRQHNIFSSLKEKVDNLFSGSASKQLRPRSLTVFGSVEEAVPDLTSFELLRVLDLKECSVLSEEHLGQIYKLLHLKYLTLGCSVSNVSVEMERLHCLETLDLRKTKIETLPMEVITLPHLAHLYGKIKLKKISGKKLTGFLQGKTNLQTLAGVVVDSNSGFPEVMVHMKKLTKVKIWCEIPSTDSNYAVLSKAIHKFAQAGMATAVGARSLSLHLNDFSKGLLHHHQGDNTIAASRKHGYLSSLKLRGSLNQSPQFVMYLRGLKELCLTYTNLKGAELLAGLGNLKLLVCLKLVEVDLADLDIKIGDFPSLQRLCLVVEKPRFPIIEHGALPRLVSLQLLCKDLVGLCDDIKVEWFEALEEVALDSMLNQQTIQLWENEVRKHPKRPRVILLKKVVDPTKTMSGKYVASRKVYNNCYTDTPQTRLQRSCQVTAPRVQSPAPRFLFDQVEVCSGPDVEDTEFTALDVKLDSLHSIHQTLSSPTYEYNCLTDASVGVVQANWRRTLFAPFLLMYYYEVT
ncbi:disease resistance protein RGA4 isoform X2 [Aegilops tauschii subsp. strangulata]|nr:disease resistance protein RGA4 isoform X2 [Aegilops tauschii subsp. strangulata]